MKIYLIHGWGGSSQGGWFDWLTEKLKDKAEVSAFDMPDADKPEIEKWVSYIQDKVNIDDKTYLIGHSIGCQTILRFLEKLPENIKIKGCVFVAGWFNLKNLGDDEKEIAKPWLTKEINFEKVKKHCNNFLALFSDNDMYVPLSNAELFKKNLNAKIVIKKNLGHFDNVDEIKEILEFVR